MNLSPVFIKYQLSVTSSPCRSSGEWSLLANCPAFGRDSLRMRRATSREPVSGIMNSLRVLSRIKKMTKSGWNKERGQQNREKDAQC